MSTILVDLQAERDRALSKADEILSAAERAKRPLSAVENGIVNKCTAQARDLGSEIDRVKEVKRLRTTAPNSYQLRLDASKGHEGVIPSKLSPAYMAAFYEHVASSGSRMSASLEEGTNSAGGYAVPSTVAGEVVPLAPSDFAVRNLAKVIPTTKDIRSPQAATISSAFAKSEGSAFTASGPTLNQFTLSAFLTGVEGDISTELSQDATMFETFLSDDMSLAIQENEESLFISGTGSGQPQGMLGNIDTGVAAATADGAGNLLSIDATFDILKTLKGRYHNSASWLMQRASAIELRKAQKQSALYEAVFTRENGQDYLHGYPVSYSESMPAIAAGATPVIFGSFVSGYLIGDRGGPAIRLKVLDQTKALYGLVTVIFYRRTDGRVRCSEALKALTLHT
jgi:HK97 family phage major capsid protein